MPSTGWYDCSFLGKHDRPIAPCLSDIDITANNWFALARQVGRLFIAVVIFLFILHQLRLI